MKRAEAELNAKMLMQRGRINTLLVAMEEAVASLEHGMAHGALGTLREALHEDKSFYAKETEAERIVGEAK